VLRRLFLGQQQYQPWIRFLFWMEEISWGIENWLGRSLTQGASYALTTFSYYYMP
jgi:hypothetical protein